MKTFKILNVDCHKEIYFLAIEEGFLIAKISTQFPDLIKKVQESLIQDGWELQKPQ